MVRKRFRVKGNTLPEVLVACVIFSCVCTLVFGTWGEWGNGKRQTLKWQAIQEGNMALHAKYPLHTFRDTLKRKNWQVVVQQQPHVLPNVWIRQVNVLDKQGREWCKRVRMIN